MRLKELDLEHVLFIVERNHFWIRELDEYLDALDAQVRYFPSEVELLVDGGG